MKSIEDLPPVDIAKLPPTISVPMAGKVLGIGRDHAYLSVQRGEIPSMRVGRRIIIPTAALIRAFNLDGRDEA